MAKIEAFYSLPLQKSPVRQSPTDQRLWKSKNPAEVPAHDWSNNNDKNLQLNTSERVRGTSDYLHHPLSWVAQGQEDLSQPVRSPVGEGESVRGSAWILQLCEHRQGGLFASLASLLPHPEF